MRTAALFLLLTAIFSGGAAATERSTYVCEVTNWIQISPRATEKH